MRIGSWKWVAMLAGMLLLVPFLWSQGTGGPLVIETIEVVGTTLTIEGQNFGPSPVVILDGVELVSTVDAMGRIVAQLPPGAGGEAVLTVSDGPLGTWPRPSTDTVVIFIEPGLGPQAAGVGPPGPTGPTGPGGPPGNFRPGRRGWIDWPNRTVWC